MPSLIRSNEATATKRDVPVLLFADTDATPYTGALTGVTAALSLNGGTENATIGPSAELTRVGGAMHVCRLTQAQVNQAAGSTIYGRVPSAAGRLESWFTVSITDYDPSTAPTDATIATATETALADNITAAQTAIVAAVNAVPAATETALADNIATVGTAVAGVAASVDAIVANDFAAIPAAVVTALRTEETLSAWGVQTVPVGGSSETWPERRNGVVIGNRTVIYDSTGPTRRVIGMTLVVSV